MNQLLILTIFMVLFGCTQNPNPQQPLKTEDSGENPPTSVLTDEDLSRPSDGKKITGTILYRDITPGKSWPFLQILGRNATIREFRIETDSKDCKNEIQLGKGEEYFFRGFFSNGSVTAYACERTQKRTAHTGCVFHTDTQKKEFEESWRDPSGVVWGDIALNTDGTPKLMGVNAAKDYCASLKASLPKYLDSIFLSQCLGIGHSDLLGHQDTQDEQYFPQILPNLSG